MSIHFYHSVLLVKTENYPSLNIKQEDTPGNIEYGRCCEKYSNSTLPGAVPHLLILQSVLFLVFTIEGVVG